MYLGLALPGIHAGPPFFSLPRGCAPPSCAAASASWKPFLYLPYREGMLASRPDDDKENLAERSLARFISQVHSKFYS